MPIQCLPTVERQPVCCLHFASCGVAGVVPLRYMQASRWFWVRTRERGRHLIPLQGAYCEDRGN